MDEEIANRQKLLRNKDDKFFEVSDDLKAKEKQILLMDAKQLRQAMNKGEVTSVELVNLFGIRCRDIGLRCNLITEENFVEALSLAE